MATLLRASSPDCAHRSSDKDLINRGYIYCNVGCQVPLRSSLAVLVDAHNYSR